MADPDIAKNPFALKVRTYLEKTGYQVHRMDSFGPDASSQASYS